MLKFVVSLLTTHQYNVPALDQYLSETVPVIMNSNSRASDESSVIVVTLDGTPTTPLGFANQGNHVVTVVIPNQAAIDAGMRSGHFLATNQYDHYSLLRTIEESLGLPGQLTQNDKYAFPMNEFWNPEDICCATEVGERSSPLTGRASGPDPGRHALIRWEPMRSPGRRREWSRSVAGKLSALPATVITVDIRDADVVADLSTSAERRAATDAVLDRCSGFLDGAVLAAGLGPTPGMSA